jgi:hypothetical protein
MDEGNGARCPWLELVVGAGNAMLVALALLLVALSHPRRFRPCNASKKSGMTERSRPGTA